MAYSQYQVPTKAPALPKQPLDAGLFGSPDQTPNLSFPDQPAAPQMAPYQQPTATTLPVPGDPQRMTTGQGMVEDPYAAGGAFAGQSYDGSGITAGRNTSMLPGGDTTGYQAPTQYSPGQGNGMYLGDFLQSQAATPSLHDPSLQPIVDAGRLADQRSADRQRAALAEQLGAGGLGSSGAMNVEQGKIRQQQGETQAMRESGLLQQETAARRANLLSGLGLDASRYQFDQDAGIRLAALEAALNGQAVSPFFGG